MVDCTMSNCSALQPSLYRNAASQQAHSMHRTAQYYTALE